MKQACHCVVINFSTRRIAATVVKDEGPSRPPSATKQLNPRNVAAVSANFAPFTTSLKFSFLHHRMQSKIAIIVQQNLGF
jgi:hypothetical protein